MSPQVMRDQWYQGQAEAQAIACWLNCYLREFALPRNQAELDYRGQDAPASLVASGGPLLRLSFDEPGHLLCVQIAGASRLGRCAYVSPPYLKSPGQPWRCTKALDMVHFLLERLAHECGFNAELKLQTANSIEITRHLLKHAEYAELTGDPLLDAEQGMLWGHALHPTPKSREGVMLDEVLACAPEARTRFPLYWFRIDPRLLRSYGQDTRATLAKLAGAAGRYPCHPWEAAQLLAHPLIHSAMARGWIEPLGVLGTELYPTSSVRTLYHPELDYFLKLSIHVRLTNCVRKNAWYELESAVALTALLAPVWEDVSRRAPGFDVLAEPAASTLDFAPIGGDTEQQRELAESFGILYRDNLPVLERERYRPQVAGALFTTDRHGRSLCRALVQHTGASILPWFESYATLLLDGVWLAFFEHGVILEPHLQNTVIGFDHGLPARVWVRDLEGTKLVDTLWPETRLGGLSPRARASVHYSQENGWQRVAYCALVNNLGEAIFHLAGNDQALEGQLWNVVAVIARRWQQRHGPQPLLQELLSGTALPSKNNLRTRLFKRADREADYTMLANPIAWRVAAARAAA